MTVLEQPSGQSDNTAIPSRRLADRPCGTRAGFSRGCRCLPCKAANARRDKAVWTDAEAAKLHLQRLEALKPSIGVHQAAKLSGLSPAHVYRIRTGQQRRVKVATADAILAIPPIAAGGQTVNGYRTRDYLRRLVKEGYTVQQLAGWLGKRDPWEVRRIRSRHSVKVRSVLRVQGLFDVLTAECSA